MNVSRRSLFAATGGLAAAALLSPVPSFADPSGVSPAMLRRALAALQKHAAAIPNRDVIAIADFSLPSRARVSIWWMSQAGVSLHTWSRMAAAQTPGIPAGCSGSPMNRARTRRRRARTERTVFMLVRMAPRSGLPDWIARTATPSPARSLCMRPGTSARRWQGRMACLAEAKAVSRSRTPVCPKCWRASARAT